MVVCIMCIECPYQFRHLEISRVDPILRLYWSIWLVLIRPQVLKMI